MQLERFSPVPWALLHLLLSPPRSDLQCSQSTPVYTASPFSFGGLCSEVQPRPLYENPRG